MQNIKQQTIFSFINKSLLFKDKKGKKKGKMDHEQVSVRRWYQKSFWRFVFTLLWLIATLWIFSHCLIFFHSLRQWFHLKWAGISFKMEGFSSRECSWLQPDNHVWWDTSFCGPISTSEICEMNLDMCHKACKYAGLNQAKKPTTTSTTK